MGVESRSVRVAVGEEFTVTEDAMSTAGYRWSEEHDPAMVELVSKESRPRGAEPGGSTVQEFQFRALAPGRSAVVLRYKRPWEAEARESVTYEVEATGA